MIHRAAIAIVLCAGAGAASADPALEPPALTPIARGEQGPVRVDPPPGARTQAIAATVATGALLIATAASWIHYNNLIDEMNSYNWNGNDQAKYMQTYDSLGRWYDIRTGLACATVAAGAITGYLWTRAQPRYERVHVSVTPTGAALSLAGSF